MARWTNESLKKLSGTDRNIVIDEILYGESKFIDVTYLAPTNIKVMSLGTKSVTLIGDLSILAVDDYVNVTCGTELYKITQIDLDNNVITLDGQPTSINEYLYFPIDLTNCVNEFKLAARKATVEDTRVGLDITAIEFLEPTPVVTGTVITDVPGKSLTNGQVRLSLSSSQLEALEPLPELDDNECLMLTGFFSYKEPAVGSTPEQTKKQRICFVIRTDGVIE